MDGSKEKNIEELQKKYEKLKVKLKQKDEKIYRYKQELANSSVVERWKVGKYLHDNLAQQLTSAKISISLLKRKLTKENLTKICEEILDIIDESVDEVRNLSHDIIPMDVEKEGVGQAFLYLKKQAERQHKVNCILETGEILNKINRREVATNLYHIAQEAIKNSVNHGQAQNIKLALIEHDNKLYLHVKDDGKGFNTENGESGMGITIMKHRMEEMDGSLRIKDAKETDYTTCVTCTLPLKALSED